MGMASRTDFASALKDYRKLLSPRASSGIRSHAALVSRYYDVITPFYQYAWGASFHFSPRRADESLAEAHRRHEEGVGRLLGQRAGM